MAKHGIDSKGYIYTGDCCLITGDNLTIMDGIDSLKVKFISLNASYFQRSGHLSTKWYLKICGMVLASFQRKRKGEAHITEAMKKKLA